MTTFVYSTTPRPAAKDRRRPRGGRQARTRSRAWAKWLLAIAAVLAVGLACMDAPGLATGGAVTMTVFAAAIVAWVFSRIDDTYVALAAALALALTGVLDTEALFTSLGDGTIWLLIAAFVLAHGIAASGLAARGAVSLISGAGTVRQLVHLLTAALVLTTFAVPATSGRAALAVPVFTALAAVLPGRRRVVHALALLFPTVILLSAVASLTGAGAHLVTSHILAVATGGGIGFGQWLLLGLPLAVASSHLAAEIVLMMFTRHSDRKQPLRVSVPELAAVIPTRVTGSLAMTEKVAGATGLVVVVLWCSGSVHDLHPALVALCGALVIAVPSHGSTSLASALKTVPWSLLVFMAATAALGGALVASGAAGWLAGTVFSPVRGMPPWIFLTVVVGVSTAAHLAVGSRSARSSMLVPLVIPAAMAAGINPVLAAFASTAAAGFCHTLTSSAKPVAIFAQLDTVATFTRRDLLRLSTVLAPMHVLLVTGFAVTVWPMLGLPTIR